MRKVLTLAVGAALLCAAPAQAGKKTVTIGDNYYTPAPLRVATGTTVVWKWPGSDAAGDVHDVKLKSGPAGAKKFHSEAASTDFSFKRKLTVPGLYKIVCTLHHDMKMSIRVKRP